MIVIPIPSLGLWKLDAVNGLYRVIPAMDCNEKDQQLGTSSSS